MRIRLQPYKQGSAGCRALSEASGVKRVRLVRTRFNPRPGDVIVNWGSSQWLFDCAYVNNPDLVAVASHKLEAYRVMKDYGVCVPPFTELREEAIPWLRDGRSVVVRHLLNASGGRGITVVPPDGTHLPLAPLYTRYIPKYDEYRVHVWGGQVIDIQQKRRRTTNAEREADSQIRNKAGGWVFCREGVECPEVVTEQAIKSIEALGLDFGAADIGYTRNRDLATVYEVNTAPGVEGTTLGRYAERIRGLDN